MQLARSQPWRSQPWRSQPWRSHSARHWASFPSLLRPGTALMGCALPKLIAWSASNR